MLCVFRTGVRNFALLVSLLAFFSLGRLIAAERASELSAMRVALDSISSSDLKDHVDVLADDSFEGREAGSRGGRAAGKYILQFLEKHRLSGAGEDGSFVQSFANNYRNILGLLEGSDADLKNEVIIIGAHYDHVGYGTSGNSLGMAGYIHNGADDNASGTAGVLELVDAFSQLSQRPRRSILFAFWDGEEKGLLGSKHWINYPTIPMQRIALMINSDMIGRLRKHRLEVHGTRTMSGLRRLVSRNNYGLGLEIDFTWKMKPNSDHYSFFSRGIPILMAHTGLHDDYHRPDDDSHKINTEGMLQVSRLLFRVAYELANRPRLNEFRVASRNETPSDRLELEETMAPWPSRFGVMWQNNLPAGKGLKLTQIRANSAAERAGLRWGDRLLRFNGHEVIDGLQLRSDVFSAKTLVEVEIAREDEEKTLKLTVELDGKPSRIGISWRIDQAEPQTVVVTLVVLGSPADRAGLKLKDRIYEINGSRFTNSNDLVRLLTTLPSPIELLVERRGNLKKVQLKLPAVIDNQTASSN